MGTSCAQRRLRSLPTPFHEPRSVQIHGFVHFTRSTASSPGIPLRSNALPQSTETTSCAPHACRRSVPLRASPERSRLRPTANCTHLDQTAAESPQCVPKSIPYVCASLDPEAAQVHRAVLGVLVLPVFACRHIWSARHQLVAGSVPGTFASPRPAADESWTAMPMDSTLHLPGACDRPWDSPCGDAAPVCWLRLRIRLWRSVLAPALGPKAFASGARSVHVAAPGMSIHGGSAACPARCQRLFPLIP